MWKQAKTQFDNIIKEYSIDTNSTKGRFAWVVFFIFLLSGGIFFVALQHAVKPARSMEELPKAVPRAWASERIRSTTNFTHTLMVESFLIDQVNTRSTLPDCMHAGLFFDPAPNVLVIKFESQWHLVRNARVSSIGAVKPRKTISYLFPDEMHIWKMSEEVEITFTSSSIATMTVRVMPTLISPLKIPKGNLSICLQTIKAIRKSSDESPEL